MRFKITLEHDITQEEKVVYYDTTDSSLVDDSNNKIDLTHLFIPEFSKNDTIKRLTIQLGFSCNMTCNYCLQSKTKKGEIDYKKLDKLIEEIKKEDIERCKIEFWGGEPLLYLDEIKYIVENLNKLSPYLLYCIVTNGTLLTLENIKFFIDNFFIISISHDAQAQHNRGKDPFLNKESLDAMKELIKHRRLFFNSVITNNNINTKERIKYFASYLEVDENDIIHNGEGIVYNTNLEIVNKVSIEKEVYNDLFYGMGERYIPNVTKINRFLFSIKNGTKIENLTTKCGIDKPTYKNLSISGETLTCHNFNKKYDIVLFKDRKNCNKCLVAHMCRGGCPVIKNDEELFKKNCEVFFKYNLGIMKYIFKLIFKNYSFKKYEI